MAKPRDTDYLCHNGLSLAFTRYGCAMLLQVDIIKEQPMKPFARIKLSFAALRRGILVSSLVREGRDFAAKNAKATKKGMR